MRRARILMCSHPNVAGCPNHGDVAREILAAARRQFATRRQTVFAFGERAEVPVPYVLTDKGTEAVRDVKPLYSVPF